jgi:arylsulfatase A-like enzyme
MPRTLLPAHAPRSVKNTFLFLTFTTLVACASSSHKALSSADRPPNVVLIFTDDQGYGDLGCFGSSDIPTPHVDQLASEGMRFTSFLVSQAVCSASRAALLTGCYSERVSVQGALGVGARVGLNPDEETLAELLKEHGYATGIFGKWHLGHRAPFLPSRQGFDEWFGLPYSNDMWPVGYDGESLGAGRKSGYPELYLYEGDEPREPVRTLADQGRLTLRYAERAVEFVERHADEPFFLYLPHSLPHVPLGVNEARNGRSTYGPYGDVIAEIDDAVGMVLAALEEQGLVDDTLVIFTSDNGPWRNYGDHAGTTGGLREGKGTAWEGGVRVPCVMRLPGTIPAGAVSDALVSTIDLLPTIAALTGARLPERVIDGLDQTPVLRDPGAEPVRREYWYYYGRDLCAVRRDDWKLVLPHEYRSYEGVVPGRGGFPGPYARSRAGLELYDLSIDPGETTDVAAQHTELVAELQALAARARAELGDRITADAGSGVRPLGRLDPLRETRVEHLAVGAAVSLSAPPNAKYAAGGAASLVDGRLGSEEFTDSPWLGFKGSDLEVLVDLGEPRPLTRLAVSFLQDQGSWIFLPSNVELALSVDGTDFEVLSDEATAVEPDSTQRTTTRSTTFERRAARYVRLRATGVKTCPAWHRGAGGDAWLFVDELVVQ